MIYESKKQIFVISIVLLFAVGLLIQSEYTGVSLNVFTIQTTDLDTSVPQPNGYLRDNRNDVKDMTQTKSIYPDELIPDDIKFKKEQKPTSIITHNAEPNFISSSNINLTSQKTVIATYKEHPASRPSKATSNRNRNEITQARKVDSDKYIVFQCSGDSYCGGLGDRFKGIQSTFLLALALKRKFRIISTVPCDLYNQLGENQEPWHAPITPGLKYKMYKLLNRYRTCGDGIFGKTNITMNITEKFRESVLVFRTNQGWTHRFHEEPFKTILTSLGLDITHFTAPYMFSKVYNHLFKPQPQLSQLVDKFIRRAKPKPGIKLVCAQIRIGYNPSIPKESTKQRRNKDAWLPVLWDFLSLYNDSSKYTIFVTTDSQKIREYSQKLFPETIIDTPGKITHVDRFENKEDACEGMEKTILDFTILSHCDITVVSRSNFGKLSSELQSPASKLYTFQNGIIHEGPEGYKGGKVFNRTTKAFTDDCTRVRCPPPRDTKCAE